MTDDAENARARRLLTNKEERPLPKRFYKDVSVGEGNAILLDGRGVKTPLKLPLTLPNPNLAEAVAEEWRAQIDFINPALMPLTKLANTALDRAGPERAHVAGEVVAFAGSDLVCYRADEPEKLVELQEAGWNPVLDWAKKNLDAHFIATHGILHVTQPKDALAAVEAHVARLDDFELTPVHNLTTLTGSCLIALMLHARAISAEGAWQAAHVDEDYQISEWGEDFEAVDRRAIRKAEYDGTVRFMELLRP